MHKAPVRPKLTCPSVIPNAITNKSRMNNLQKIQNSIWKNDKHALLRTKMFPSRGHNFFLQRTDCKTWQKIQELTPEKYTELNQISIHQANERFSNSLAKTQTDRNLQFVNYIDNEGRQRN